MFSLNTDKAFNIKRSKLDEDFYLMKKIMTFSEAKEYCNNYQKYQSYFELTDRVDENTYDGIGYTYKNDKAFKKIPIRVKVSGLGLETRNFIENYEGKLVKLDKIWSMRVCHYRNDEDDIGAVIFTVDDVYNEFDWQNHLALLKLEDEWLQPDNF